MIDEFDILDTDIAENFDAYVAALGIECAEDATFYDLSFSDQDRMVEHAMTLWAKLQEG